VRFNTTQLAVAAGRPFDVVVDNRERDIPHNFAIYTDNTASEPIAVGPITTGPDQTVVAVPPLAPGTYFFRCDVHRIEMIGNVTASVDAP
jgi:hypothetical protein